VAQKITIKNQPVSKIEWIDRNQLFANSYNPNHVAPAELALLKLSILTDGWTQPIVVRSDLEIVDGYHRWLVSADPEIMALTDGKIPVAFISCQSEADQRMSTIRHNRARGSHGVLKMADLVRELVDLFKIPPAKLQKGMGMENEEVDRLYDSGGMIERGSKNDFNKGWIPDEETIGAEKKKT